MQGYVIYLNKGKESGYFNWFAQTLVHLRQASVFENQTDLMRQVDFFENNKLEERIDNLRVFKIKIGKNNGRRTVLYLVQ